MSTLALDVTEEMIDSNNVTTTVSWNATGSYTTCGRYTITLLSNNTWTAIHLTTISNAKLITLSSNYRVSLSLNAGSTTHVSNTTFFNILATANLATASVYLKNNSGSTATIALGVYA